MTTDQLKAAMAGQYRAGLAMLREAIEVCPDEFWTTGRHPREFWRVSFHTLYYTHLYLEQTEHDFQRWDKDPRPDDDTYLRDIPTPISKADMLEYCAFVDALVEPKLALLDLEAPEAGYSWYDIPKLDHQILTIRHIQDHAGQLRDRLLERFDYGEEAFDWVDRGPR